MTDAELVCQARNGQRTAYELLVRRWSARVIGYVRSKVHSQDVAEDLAQDCLLRAYRSLDSLGEPEKFGAWLLSIAHRAALDWMKAKARSEVRLSDINRDGRDRLVATSDEQPAALCERREEASKLIDEIATLPEALREVVMIYYYDKVTYQEMAEMLGVSAATINARLTKARNLLRQRYFGASSSGNLR